MRYSLKIRDAKKILPVVLEDHSPIHFGNLSEYLDYILSVLILSVHGNIGNEKYLRLYYEFKVRMENQIENHYTHNR